MADRSVKVRLEANVQGFVSGMRTAAKATEDFASRSGSFVEKHRDSINDLSNVAVVGGAALAAFSLAGIKAAADFDEAMSSVAAATMAPEAELAQLRDAAIEAGASTKYSATEAAGAIEQLAKAGVSTADILNGGLSGALNLAASDNIAVADAAEIASSAMTQFGLAGEDVTHIADLLAAGAGKAQGGVMDLGQALSQSGLVASQFGLSIEETVGGLTAFASAGVMGSDAGTSFKTMLQRLSNPTAQAQAQLDELGITVYDAQGEFVGLSEFAGQLQTAMKDMTPEARNAAMSVIFGADAVRAANVLYAEGEEGIREWIAAVDDQGFAAEQARLRMDNLKGDIEELRGALETAFIGAGEGANSALRPLVQTVTDVVNAFNGLPDAAKSALGSGAGVVGLSLLAMGALGRVATSASDLKLALNNIGIATDGTRRKLQLLGAASVAGLAITGLTLAIGAYMKAAGEAEQRTEDLASTLDQVSGAATASTQETIIQQLSDQLDAGDWEALEKIGISQADLAAAVLEGGAAYDEVKGKLDEYALAQDGAVASGLEGEAAYAKASDAMSEMNGALEDGRSEIQQNVAAQEELSGATAYTAEQQAILDSAVVELDGSIKASSDSLREFLDLLFETGLATMSAREAEAAYQESLSEVDGTVNSLIEQYGGLGEALNDSRSDFDLTTEAGREANSAFQDLAQSGMDSAEAMAEAGASQGEIQAGLEGTYNDLVSAAQAFGLTDDAAEALAREVLGIPDGVSIDSWMDDAAKRTADQTRNAVNGIDRSITIHTRYITSGTPPKSSGTGPRVATVYADGGINGPTLDRFAGGSEHHVAQIAPAGAWRLWAEPETGGEAYIPLSGAKRGRSTAILADVANRFGYQLMQAADGLVLPYQKSPTGTRAAAGPSWSPTFISNGVSPEENAAVMGVKLQEFANVQSTGHHP